MDKETQQILSDGQKWTDLVQSDGWALAKAELLQKISLLNTVSTTIFENKTPEQIASEIKERASVVQILLEWISVVEGKAEQATANAPLVDETIIRFQ